MKFEARHEGNSVYGHVKFALSVARGWHGVHLRSYIPEEAKPSEDIWDQVWGTIMNYIPETLGEIIAATGIDVVIAQKPDDIGRGSRAPDEKEFYKRAPAETEGFYKGDEGLVAVTGERYDRVSGKYKKVTDVPKVVAHEMVHALDAVTGLSDLPEFMSAYRLDVMGLSRIDDRYGYQLQEGKRGREEAAAEDGCQIWMGNCRAGNMSFDWPYSFTLTKAFFDALGKFDIKNDFIREEGSLTKKFVDAAIHEAEKALLPLVVKDDVGYNIIANGPASRRFKAAAFLESMDDDSEKSRILKGIMRRQGEDEVREAFLAYRQLVKSMGPISFP